MIPEAVENVGTPVFAYRNVKQRHILNKLSTSSIWRACGQGKGVCSPPHTISRTAISAYTLTHSGGPLYILLTIQSQYVIRSEQSREAFTPVYYQSSECNQCQSLWVCVCVFICKPLHDWPEWVEPSSSNSVVGSCCSCFPHEVMELSSKAGFLLLARRAITPSRPFPLLHEHAGNCSRCQSQEQLLW